MGFLNFFDVSSGLFEIWGYHVSYIEFFGTMLTLASVWLATRPDIMTWPTGMLGNIAFLFIFYQVRLYADMFLQVFFFISSIYGWWSWQRIRSSGANEILHANTMQRAWSIGLLGVAIIFTAYIIIHLNIWLPQFFPQPAAYPVTDSCILCASIWATILLTKKYVESWWLWIVVDILSVVVYALKGTYLIAIEYFVFLLIAVFGLVGWLKILHRENRIGTR